MKRNLNDIHAKRAELVDKMRSLVEDEAELTEVTRAEFDALEEKVNVLDADIRRLESQEELNLRSVRAENPAPAQNEETPSLLEGLRSYLLTGIAPEEYRTPKGGFRVPQEFMRAAMKTGTDVAIINKIVSDEIVIAKSPGEAFLEGLGVKIFRGLNGNFVVPAMPQLTSGFVAEGTAVADASALTTSLTLAARRVGAYNDFSKEFLNQTNPGIYAGVIQDLQDSIWRQIASDFFDQLEADAIDASTSVPATMVYNDVVARQASVLYDMASPAYVTTGTIASKLKSTAALTNQAAIWQGPLMNGNIDGIPAFATVHANADKLYYGDFSQGSIGLWGDMEIIVDPYSKGKEGELRVIANVLADTGVANYRFFNWVWDVSI